jgi:hypothetical protein
MKHLVKFVILSFLVILSACENEPIGTMNLNQQVLDEELFELIVQVAETEGENAINCIEFNYAFVIFVFDAQMEFTEAVSIRSDLEFSTFLGNLDETYSISLNYPISGTLNNGEFIEINTNEELKEAIDACQAEELQRRCNGTLIDCVWIVGELEDHPNDYEGAYYKLRYDGSVQFHYKDDVFFGTWVTLFIGQELYLNIDLNDDLAIEAFWDLNWKVDLRSNERIEISDGDTEVLIQKDCSIPCVETGYRLCEFEDNPGFAEFILEDYTTCIPVPYTHDVVSAVTYSFHETEEDALLGVNPVSTTSYENTSNPQIIYVRIVYKETGEVLHLSQIAIEAIPCP